jgi:diaminohydroxyphosphoribosylaminopyrimidine deaminase/5-amino-6-(5-phosphoribosylamino)uracil reductase
VSNDDHRWMGAALTLASRAVGTTWPNPPVGCIIIKDNRVIGRGHTQPTGRPHAESMALQGTNAKGATAYVTLEPCAHQSPRGPDCTTTLIKSGVARVVIACKDPDPRTNGQGIAKLQAAGIEVISGTRAAESRALMPGYIAGRPHITLKLALSLDGSLALANGTSQWITGKRARIHAHIERARADLIVVGSGTLAADHPKLDVRIPGIARQPKPALLGRGPAPQGWEHFQTIEMMQQSSAHSILVEGGAGVAASLLDADLVDRLLIYRAPILMGGKGISLGLHEIPHDRWTPGPILTLAPDRLETYTRNR